MILCPHCNSKNLDTYNFCTSCGSRLHEGNTPKSIFSLFNKTSVKTDAAQKDSTITPKISKESPKSPIHKSGEVVKTKNYSYTVTKTANLSTSPKKQQKSKESHKKTEDTQSENQGIKIPASIINYRKKKWHVVKKELKKIGFRKINYEQEENLPFSFSYLPGRVAKLTINGKDAADMYEGQTASPKAKIVMTIYALPAGYDDEPIDDDLSLFD